MKKGLLIIVVLICVGVQVWAGGGKEHTTKTPEQSQQAHVSIDNFNRITEYTKVPDRIIVLSIELCQYAFGSLHQCIIFFQTYR